MYISTTSQPDVDCVLSGKQLLHLLHESHHVAALAVSNLLVMQAVLYLQHNSSLLEKGTELGEQDLLAFSNIRVSIHHVITDRIDHLRPSQQLTLKVRL